MIFTLVLSQCTNRPLEWLPSWNDGRHGTMARGQALKGRLLNGPYLLNYCICARVDQLLILGMGDLPPLIGNLYNWWPQHIWAIICDCEGKRLIIWYGGFPKQRPRLWRMYTVGALSWVQKEGHGRVTWIRYFGDDDEKDLDWWWWWWWWRRWPGPAHDSSIRVFDQKHRLFILISISNRSHHYGFLKNSKPGMIQSEEGRVFEEVKRKQFKKNITKKIGKVSAMFWWNSTIHVNLHGEVQVQGMIWFVGFVGGLFAVTIEARSCFW